MSGATSAMQSSAPRRRDPLVERQERRRYALLQAIFQRTGEDCQRTITAVQVGEALGITREETFRLIQFLAQHGYLGYLGAGPRVCMTDRGVKYLRDGAGRRHSVRHPGVERG
jgi:DNA-binding IclR family transcriptional regulator